MFRNLYIKGVGRASTDRTAVAIRPYSNCDTSVLQLQYGRTPTAVRSANATPAPAIRTLYFGQKKQIGGHFSCFVIFLLYICRKNRETMIPKKSLSDQSISVVINTYNAEEHLEKVVKAVQDFDEVLVCDMESTDHTVEIARRLGCRVITFPKANHKSAEPARTFAIQSATSPWVLVVDADEIVTPDLRLYLYRHIATPGCAEGLYIPRKNYFLHQLFGYPDYQLRFFIREGTEWPPYVHTFPIIKGLSLIHI